MTRFISRFGLGVALFAFVASTVGAWEAIYTRPVKDGSGNSVRAIYLRTQDGTEVRLTDGRFDDGDPEWSPDETEIVFSSDRNGNRDVLELFVLNPRVGEASVRFLGIKGTYPAISKDYLAYNASVGNRTKLFVVPRRGGVPVDLGIASWAASFSPDQALVSFSSGMDDEGVVVAKVDGTLRRNIAVGTRSVFANDHQVAYELEKGTRPEIRVYDLDTGEDRFLAMGLRPSVSDGFVVFAGEGGWFAIRPDGTGKVLLLPYEPNRGDVRFFGKISDSRPVVPRGKVPSVWGQLKK